VKVGIGVSCEELSWQAGLLAAADAVAGSGLPELAVVVATPNYDCEALLAGAKSVLGESRLVGASCAGFFTLNGIYERGVGVLTVAGKGLTANSALIANKTVDPESSGQKLAEALLTDDTSNGGIICFPDGFGGQNASFVDALYDAAGPEFSYVGGGTGDDLQFNISRQMTDQGVACGGVAAALLSGCSLYSEAGHGWVPTGPPLVVSQAEGKVVYELDGRAAFEVYAERLGGVTEETFAEIAMRHPLGVAYGPDRYIVRDPVQVVDGTGIQFATEIPSRAVAYIMQPKNDPTYSCASELAGKVLARVGKPRFALASYCISRALLLGDGYQEEIASLLAPFGEDVAVLGMLAFGEVGAYVGVPQFHNKSISLLVGGE